MIVHGLNTKQREGERRHGRNTGDGKGRRRRKREREGEKGGEGGRI